MLKRGATHWRRSTFCATGECVEVARAGEDVVVRNSTDGDNVVAFTPEAWTDFVEAIRDGEFDQPNELADVN
ncbi:hypothetical protein Val02_44670 [Virgisporangium aliadipatigenens]|uniref:DUF397 domain-containing protein n=1 Tax=Virgisporangium aliadipatigenens TaxID=741659 RepID=A0A8J3YLV3_9ACTN|nr:DUF397 domain-containing protein [Virgisporangium aliadipatigenens]GIJ47581.1 hypothetical protein Val02_44670 [Virgisporangium aliadipatigenens]